MKLGSIEIILIAAGISVAFIGVIVGVLIWVFHRKRKIQKQTERLLNEKSNLVFPQNGVGQTQQTFEEIRQCMIESPSPTDPQYLGPRSSFAGYNLPKKVHTYGSISDSLSICRTESYKSRKTSTDSGIASSIGIGNVIPDLYQRRGTIIRRESSPSALICGNLHFKLLYLFKTSDLMVKIEQVNSISSSILSLLNANKLTLSSFVTIEMVPAVDQKIRQTSLKKKEFSPVFGETFKFPIAYEELYTHLLTFSIYDLNEEDYSKQKFGKATIPLNTVDPSMEVEIWLDMVIIEPEKRETRGQLLVSLNYLPSAERLTLVIMKAKDVIIPNLNEDNQSFFVRVNQYEKEKIIKKHKTGCQKQDSLVWNEVMAFKFNKEKLNDIYFQVKLIQKDVKGNEINIGDFNLGTHSNSRSGMEHFYDIICESKETFTMWHNIQRDL